MTYFLHTFVSKKLMKIYGLNKRFHSNCGVVSVLILNSDFVFFFLGGGVSG